MNGPQPILTVFTAASGIPLADAICASCAVPGVWPPAEINGRIYIDGGVWKAAENVHLDLEKSLC